jgi:carbohydrate diacid regulator
MENILSKTIAEEIINEIKTEIKSHINLMNEQGVIIASTDPKRVGMLHQGALQILQNNLDELFVSEDEATETTYKGINLAIHFENRTIGVIGLTGSRKEVYKLGKIVRKMTEVLLSESFRQRNHSFYELEKLQFISTWIKTQNVQQNHALMKEGRKFGIDVTIQRRCIAISHKQLTDREKGALNIQKQSHLRNFIQTVVESEIGGIYFQEGNLQYGIFSSRSNKEILHLAEHLSRLVQERFGLKIHIGYDAHPDGMLHPAQIMDQAGQALNSAINQDRLCVGYQELTTGIIFNDISNKLIREYLLRIFGDCAQNTFESHMEIVNLYFRFDGAISEMADALFIHRNTLQYRLRKLLNDTGFDIRKPSESGYFYIAAELYKIYKNRVFA